MKNTDLFNSIGRLWIIILFIGVFIVINIVNFGFLNNTLKEELITHNAINKGDKNACSCDNCGLIGMAYCMHCGTPMKWDKTFNHFICPNCKNAGLPLCPICNVPMTGLTANKTGTNALTGSPVPIY